jgi:hypothetical protein
MQTIARPPLSILPRLGGQKLIPPFAQRLEDAAVQATAQLELAKERTQELIDSMKPVAVGPELQALGESRTTDLLGIYSPIVRGLARRANELATSKSFDVPLSTDELADSGGTNGFRHVELALSLDRTRTWLLGMDGLAAKLELESAFGVGAGKPDLIVATAAATLPRPIRAQLEQRSGLDLRKLTRDLRERMDPTSFAQLTSLPRGSACSSPDSASASTSWQTWRRAP